MRLAGRWVPVDRQRMDAAIVIEAGRALCRKLREIRAGDAVVCGIHGIKIVPEFQDLDVGDLIPMLPAYGPRVRSLERGRYLLAGDAEEGTWCLALVPGEGGTRLISRWRLNRRITPANALMMLLSDPGAFIMERKMLKGIKARAERTATGKSERVPSPRKDPVA